MSSHQTAPVGVGHTQQEGEGLQTWNCTNCRRRKVRCDRRYPCNHCTKNKAECVFPVSGRLPRRGRNPSNANPATQRQVELAGRLRRLEAMVGGLGSQFEAAVVGGPGAYPAVNTMTSTTSAHDTPSEIDMYELRTSSQSMSSSSGRAPTQGGESDYGLPTGSAQSPPSSGTSGDLVVTNDGGLVVPDQFWTVFCKEVRESLTILLTPQSIVV